MTTAVKAARKARAPQKAYPIPKALPRTGNDSPRTSSSGVLPEIPAFNAMPLPAWKRMLDILCILISLPVLLPLMAAITLWIKLASQGPALFRQERIGRNGKRFVLYKFRSMHLHAETRRHENHFRNLVRLDQPMVKLDLLCDSRLIPGGCFFRAAGLDELPQLLNVLRGEMSLVGPRPCLVEEFRFFNARQRERFTVLPGLTGIWQVHGKGASTFSEMNAMDALYVRRYSPAMDLGIMLRTPLALCQQMRHVMWQSPSARAETGSESSEGTPLSGYNPQHLG